MLERSFFAPHREIGVSALGRIDLMARLELRFKKHAHAEASARAHNHFNTGLVRLGTVDMEHIAGVERANATKMVSECLILTIQQQQSH